MGEHVRVESVEALTKFRAALCKFASTVQVALDEAEAEIQRTSFWVKQEQHNYWKRQAEKRAELYTRAKSELNRKKAEKTALGGRYSCVDEQKALAAAERRLEEAKQKLTSVRRWSRLLDEESSSYLATAQGMSLAVQVEVPNALAQLDNMVKALEAYASSAAPGEQRSMASLPGVEDFGRPEELASVAREAPPPPDVAAEAYQKYRAQTPSQAVRNNAPIAAPQFHGWTPDVAGRAVPEVLADLDLAAAPVATDDKIVVAHGTWQQRRIYLERVESPTAGDSGWYVGFADDTEATGYDAVRVADFLAGRPDLEAALGLPVGCLLVLDGASVEAVLDPQGELVWPSRASRH